MTHDEPAATLLQPQTWPNPALTCTTHTAAAACAVGGGMCELQLGRHAYVACVAADAMHMRCMCPDGLTRHACPDPLRASAAPGRQREAVRAIQQPLWRCCLLCGAGRATPCIALLCCKLRHQHRHDNGNHHCQHRRADSCSTHDALARPMNGPADPLRPHVPWGRHVSLRDGLCELS